MSPSIESETVPVSAANFLEFFGVGGGNLPTVTIDSALRVPAVAAAVTFLSATMASLPLHVYRTTDAGGAEPVKGSIQRLLNEAPNDEWSSFAWRKYFWQQVFTGGRGLSWIERAGSAIVNIWPIDPAEATVQRIGGRRSYLVNGREYPAADVIDVPFMLRRDQLSVHGPIMLGAKTIALAIAMGDYAANFFAGGGVPPLSLTGPLPAGPDAMKRALADVQRSIDAAKNSDKPIFAIPPSYELKPIGFDPDKGQMTEARRFQIEEIARIYNLPPVFLQDLTNGTYSNTEQQDLNLTKHLVAQWAAAFEDELNLKLFGRRNNGRYVEHSLDGLMRGDLKSRIEALARGVNASLLTPDEARALDNRPARPGGDVLYIQGATVPLTMAGTFKPTPAAPKPESEADAQAS